jgi:hypothetical protein
MAPEGPYSNDKYALLKHVVDGLEAALELADVDAARATAPDDSEARNRQDLDPPRIHSRAEMPLRFAEPTAPRMSMPVGA